MSYKPFKMKGHTLPGIRQKSHDTQSGKSPYQKELVGDQENLNEGLKRAIENTPAKRQDSYEKVANKGLGPGPRAPHPDNQHSIKLQKMKEFDEYQLKKGKSTPKATKSKNK